MNELQKTLRDKYLPVLVGLLVSLTAFGQAPPAGQLQRLNAFGYDWLRGNFRNSLGIPADTVSLTPDQKLLPQIAGLNGFFYMWNVALQRWEPIAGSGGSVFDSTSLSTRIDQKVGYGDTAAMLANYLTYGDTAALFATLLSNFNDQLLSIQQAVTSNRLDSLTDVNTAGAQAGYVLKYNPLSGKWEAVMEKYAKDILVTRVGNYSYLYLRYNDNTVGVGTALYDQTGDNTMDTLEVFENTSGSQFTLQKEPSSILSVHINNVPVSDQNYSVVGFLLTIVGYSLDPTEKLIIKYSYPKS